MRYRRATHVALSCIYTGGPGRKFPAEIFFFFGNKLAGESVWKVVRTHVSYRNQCFGNYADGISIAQDSSPDLRL
jgi:hypothetical protein